MHRDPPTQKLNIAAPQRNSLTPTKAGVGQRQNQGTISWGMNVYDESWSYEDGIPLCGGDYSRSQLRTLTRAMMPSSLYEVAWHPTAAITSSIGASTKLAIDRSAGSDDRMPTPLQVAQRSMETGHGPDQSPNTDADNESEGTVDETSVKLALLKERGERIGATGTPNRKPARHN
jgi:hypothetical protein